MAKEGTNEGDNTTINLTDEPDKEEELIPPPLI